MSTTNPMQGNSELAEISWEPAEIPEGTIWSRKLVAFGRRISKLLRIRNWSEASEGDQEYFGM